MPTSRGSSDRRVSGVLHAVLEQRAVREPRQVVVEGLHQQPFLELVTQRDVGHGPGHAAATTFIVLDRLGADLDPDVGSVMADEPELMSELLQLTAGHWHDQVRVELTVVGVDEEHDRVDRPS